MNEIVALVSALMAGFLIGVLFFGGLWWTVQKVLTSNHPALWLFGSTIVRTGVALAGFYFMARGDWRRILVCVLGFFIARVVVIRITHPTRKEIDAS